MAFISIVPFKLIFSMKRGYLYVSWRQVKMYEFCRYAFWNLKVYKQNKCARTVCFTLLLWNKTELMKLLHQKTSVLINIELSKLFYSGKNRRPLTFLRIYFRTEYGEILRSYVLVTINYIYITFRNYNITA